jgi:hypothetical protein
VRSQADRRALDVEDRERHTGYWPQCDHKGDNGLFAIHRGRASSSPANRPGTGRAANKLRRKDKASLIYRPDLGLLAGSVGGPCRVPGGRNLRKIPPSATIWRQNRTRALPSALAWLKGIPNIWGRCCGRVRSHFALSRQPRHDPQVQRWYGIRRGSGSVWGMARNARYAVSVDRCIFTLHPEKGRGPRSSESTRS